MTVFKKEMRQGVISLFIWTAVTAFMMILCIFLFPEMKGQMNDVNDLFSNMGGFTEAFGMNRVGFGEIMGFYAVECGNILGIGGGFFAAYIGISSLAKEEKDKTAEFLLTHPISRVRVLTEKLLSIFLQVLIFNVIVILSSILSLVIIGETVKWSSFCLLHIAFFIMQIEIAVVCFGISSFLKKSAIGVGLGLTMILYFMNIVKNISANADFLKYITPFSYADSTGIVADERIQAEPVITGVIISVTFLIIGFMKYLKKDIQ